MGQGRYLSAQEACRALDIKPQTLYAYVSRGLVRSEVASAARRSRRYYREDIERLRRRGEIRTHPEKAAEGVLRSGDPVLESALTLIDDDAVYYRGVSVADLAVSRSVEEVASLLWTGRIDADISDRVRTAALPPDLRRRMKDLAGLDLIGRIQSLLPVAAHDDQAALDLNAPSVFSSGAAILRLMTAIATGRVRATSSMAHALQRAWAPEDGQAADLINAALILCADHELNVSAFAARCVASSGANLYAVVTAGLSALQGFQHGRASDRVEAFWSEVQSADTASAVVTERLKRGELLPGFGHVVYRGVDPRGRLLLGLTAKAYPKSPAVVLAREIVDAVAGATDLHYNLDLALVTMRHAMGLRGGIPTAIFALGRTVGWIGHAIEQYQVGRLIRPRARYSGPSPGSSPVRESEEVSTR